MTDTCSKPLVVAGHEIINGARGEILVDACTGKKIGYYDDPAVDLFPQPDGTLRGSDGRIYYDNPTDFKGVPAAVFYTEAALLVILLVIGLNALRLKLPTFTGWLRR